jgi:nitrate/TMAO reductase-like tetraheme cytochrome c subunit
MFVAAGRRLIFAVVVALLGLESAAGADKAAQGVSDADSICTGCHVEGTSKKLANGDMLSLAVDGAAFARSVHAPIGCAACHARAAAPDHPGNVENFGSARQYALAQNQACRACHDRVFEEYERSVHAARVREGNAAAPVCGDCHPPHGVARASVQGGPKETCLACHGGVERRHGEWLPNPGNHLRAVTCSACHAPGAQPRVDLQLLRGAEPIRDRDAAVPFSQRARAADADGDGLDANELRALLADLERSGGKVSLRGRIELRSGVEAHELPAKAQAIRDCARCHDANAAAFQNVTVSVLDADGMPVRYDAHREVLNSATTWDALRGFYAIGGTRFKLLDIVLAVGLVGGLAVPALHLAVRRRLRRPPESDGGRE